MRNHGKRLQKVESQILSLPIAPALVKKAFARFQEEGVLPEDLRLATAVVRRAMSGAAVSDACNSGASEPDMIRALLASPRRPDDEVMDSLYSEALSTCEPVRDAARHMLAVLSDMGCDVTQPVFAKRGKKIELPDWGAVGRHFLGFPECLMVPPYEEQARRLFARYAELRERIDQDDRRWFDALATAVDVFREDGELPNEELMREAVLAGGEIMCLVRHQDGEDVGELIAGFDAAATPGDERNLAITRVQEMARESRVAAADVQ